MVIPSTVLLILLLCSSHTLAADADVLLALKLRFHHPGPSLSSWDETDSASLCLTWAGIECSPAGRVVSLLLTDMNLHGTVSFLLLSRLDRLVNLSLAGNGFSGEFGSLTNLPRLRSLDLSNNQLTGDLAWIDPSSFPELEVFDAYDNNFTGSLPSGLLGLTKLRYLSLGGNYFWGKIPPSLGGLVKLEYLSLDGNDLSGRIPAELGNLTRLRVIYLGQYNAYEGNIPDEFGNLTGLVHLDLSSCGLEGNIPKTLGRLAKLHTLYLHINSLSGAVPGELGNLTNLVSLDLSINSLTGEIPPEFVNLTKLRLLNMFMNRLHGSIPDFVAGFPNLEALALWRNNFTGTMPRGLGSNGRLRELDLSTNKLTGTIPSELCLSDRLQILILLNNFLFGPIPESLGTCNSLVKVRLGQNYLNGSIPTSLIYLPHLNLLELQNNLLSGVLMESMNNESLKPVALQELNLENNKISGMLPDSISNFSCLQILIARGNQFSGPIPVSIGEVRQLARLDLSENAFNGEIPQEIGNCYNLNHMDISQNNLSGPIPGTISKLHFLNYLNLSGNHLTRIIPEAIGTVQSLTTADFSYNNLSGRIPDSGLFVILNTSSFMGNPELCGHLLNRSCHLGGPKTVSHRTNLKFRFIFMLAMSGCVLILVAAVIVKVTHLRRNDRLGRWKMTAFQKIDFSVNDVLECVKDGNEIGRGGAGVVFHGQTPCSTEIAIKKLLVLGWNRNYRSFRGEIETLGRIRHRNIVRLMAFCSNGEMNLLIFEYMKNGSLGEALSGKKGRFLGWNTRYRIAIEAARGLSYLHHDCSPMIVHRDVKSSNILLNSSNEAHIADFGLAKFMSDGGASESMSVIAGSYGYIAPEYAYTLKVDEKTDVYSFGVVLLELLTGRRPVGEFGMGVDIVQWTRIATNGLRENVGCILDPKLTNVPKDEAMRLYFIATMCVQENRIERPAMREVEQMLSEQHRNSPESHTSSSSSTTFR
ncbi:hypothetical protein MLD38_000042 [Melastoma candidum]|uniref:Uncharacterized protein n=1 Tax=Melastoma candidum TaxID=119954 RepID=A0ACB9SC40_9MYRT|nr:hypothetical protein MLD38_000042 [Melastoma candidum]